jgi:purine-binding chemotaxis protein CheW
MNQTATGQWATFHLGGEQFALPVEEVQEVLVKQPLTPVPLAPPEILGLLNLRGAIMPAIDLRRRLGFPDAAVSEPKLLVLKGEEGPLSVVVDDIGDVFELEGAGWRSVPDTLEAVHRDFVFGVFPLESQVLLGLRLNLLTSEGQSGAP